MSQRDPWLVHDKLDVIVKSGALKDRAVVLDLKDYQRALVWIDGRFSHVLPPGLFAYWNDLRDVKVDVVDARSIRFEHVDLQLTQLLDLVVVDLDRLALRFVENLAHDQRGDADESGNGSSA